MTTKTSDPATIAANLDPVAEQMLLRAIGGEDQGNDFTRCPSAKLGRRMERAGLVACCPLDGPKHITPTRLGRAVAAELETE